jgi:hypothetical protein
MCNLIKNKRPQLKNINNSNNNLDIYIYINIKWFLLHKKNIYRAYNGDSRSCEVNGFGDKCLLMSINLLSCNCNW